MLSLDNAYNEDELRAWATRVEGALPPSEKPKYVCELKLDGLSLALHYEAGTHHTAHCNADSPVATAPSAKMSPPTFAPFDPCRSPSPPTSSSKPTCRKARGSRRGCHAASCLPQAQRRACRCGSDCRCQPTQRCSRHHPHRRTSIGRSAPPRLLRLLPLAWRR